MQRLASFSAILGGVVLSGLIVLTCLSVFGRIVSTVFHSMAAQTYFKAGADFFIGTGIASIYGDFELVEAGLAFSVFAFLPICQLHDGHAKVDLIFGHFPRWLQRGLNIITAILFAVVLVVVAWRLYEGMNAKMRYGETTFLLQFPLWWAYGACFVMAVFAAFVACYGVVVALKANIGAQIFPEENPLERS
jgi:TRAP-type C4-dicarboxylate transport system permease small subunit